MRSVTLPQKRTNDKIVKPRALDPTCDRSQLLGRYAESVSQCSLEQGAAFEPNDMQSIDKCLTNQPLEIGLMRHKKKSNGYSPGHDGMYVGSKIAILLVMFRKS